MKKFIFAYAILAVFFSFMYVGLDYIANGEKSILFQKAIYIDGIIGRITEQERKEYPYVNYIVLDGQPRFEMEKSTWDDFTGDESFGYIPKRNSAWEYFSWPGEVTPGKEKKHNEEITPTTSIFAPVISEELSSEIKPDSLK